MRERNAATCGQSPSTGTAPSTFHMSPNISRVLRQVLAHEAIEVAQAAAVEAHYYFMFGASRQPNLPVFH